ncbi:MAG: SDR family NAD(P)-dependent oxidoreductase, partial [Chloroflexi bacterium]
MDKRLKNRVALITGSGQGIGRAIACRFAQEGAKVVVIDIMEDCAQAVAGEIKTTGGDALALVCDVTKRDQVESAVQEALATYGRIDILCNNAGITRDARLVKMTEEQFDTVIDVNL